MRTASPQNHQLLRIFHRQEPEEHLVDQREDGGIRADTESQRKDRNRNKYRRLTKRAERVAKILSQGSHVEQYRPYTRTLPVANG